MLQCCKCERILRKSEKHFTPYRKFHLGSFLKDIIYEMDATKFVRTRISCTQLSHYWQLCLQGPKHNWHVIYGGCL